MDFAITDDQRALAGLAREILADQVTHTHLSALEAESHSVFDRALWARLAEAGLTGLVVGAEYGGAGLGFLDLALLLEEIGRAVAPVPAVATLAMGSLSLSRHGNAEQKQRILPGVAEGSIILTAALAEPGEALRTPLTTTATKVDGGWRLDGEKSFVPYAAEADWLLVPAATDDGVGVFLVRSGVAGLTVTSLLTTSHEPQAQLGLAGVLVTEADLLGSVGEAVLHDLLLHATAAYCSVQAGVCAAALRMTAAYTTTREQFGKPIASFQAVGQRAGDAYIDTEVVRLTAHQAAWRLTEGWGADDEVAIAKFWAGDGGSRVVHACQHLHGGIGVDLEYPLHRYFLWTKQIELHLGSPTRQLLALGASLAATPV